MCTKYTWFFVISLASILLPGTDKLQCIYHPFYSPTSRHIWPKTYYTPCTKRANTTFLCLSWSSYHKHTHTHTHTHVNTVLISFWLVMVHVLSPIRSLRLKTLTTPLFIPCFLLLLQQSHVVQMTWQAQLWCNTESSKNSSWQGSAVCLIEGGDWLLVQRLWAASLEPPFPLSSTLPLPCPPSSPYSCYLPCTRSLNHI